MEDQNNGTPSETSGLFVLSSHPTYRAGENAQRLVRQAQEFGLDEARRPTNKETNVPFDNGGGGSSSDPLRSSSMLLRDMFSDHTFSSAMMHSVGTLGRDEYVDNRGSIHLISVRRRRGGLTVGEAPMTRENNLPSYGKLQDLFRKSAGKLPSEHLDEQPEEDEDFEFEDQVEGGSLTAAIFGIIKGTVGPAILYLPRGFKMAGWACAIPALLFATFAYIYSAHRLLQCWRVVDARQRLLAQRMGEMQNLLMPDVPAASAHSTTGSPADKSNQPPASSSSFDDSSAFSPKLLTYPELARKSFGKYAIMIEFGIAAMQFGVCLTYLIFVPANLHASCQQLFGWDVPRSYFLIGMVLLEIPCTWIRDIRRLTPFNVLATILIAYGLGSCLIIACWYSYHEKLDETLWESITSLPKLQPTWFLFIGTAFFVFEGSITLVVPLQEAVYKPEDRDRFPKVNQQVTSAIVVFYIVFAMVCWASFEDRVQTALTASLPAGIYSTTVQFAYSIAVIFTYPLQAFPAMEVILKNINTTFPSPNQSNKHQSNGIGNTKQKAIWRRNIFATLLNIGLGIIAVIAIDYLGNVVSLLGSLVGMPIALVYPPIMHNILVKDAPPTARYMNYLVAGIGGFATVAASYATIVNWNEGQES